jgi:hypothetical protein
MFVYWIYSLLAIFYSWLFYKLTSKNIYAIIFYLISLIIIGLYYFTNLIISLYLDFKYKKDLNLLHCKLRQCNNIIKKHTICYKEECNTPDTISEKCKLYCKDDYQNILCENIFNCNNHYLCKPYKNKCIIRQGNCKILIEKQIQSIKNKQKNELMEAIKTLDKIGIRKKTLDEYLKINIYVLSVLFMLFLLYLYYTNKVSIIFDFVFLDTNYIKKKLNKIN